MTITWAFAWKRSKKVQTCMVGSFCVQAWPRQFRKITLHWAIYRALLEQLHYIPISLMYKFKSIEWDWFFFQFTSWGKGFDNFWWCSLGLALVILAGLLFSVVHWREVVSLVLAVQHQRFLRPLFTSTRWTTLHTFPVAALDISTTRLRIINRIHYSIHPSCSRTLLVQEDCRVFTPADHQTGNLVLWIVTVIWLRYHQSKTTTTIHLIPVDPCQVSKLHFLLSWDMTSWKERLGREVFQGTLLLKI